MEEQFFGENAAYTGNLGGGGTTAAARDASLAAIVAVLPGFQPDVNASFSFMVATTVAPPCFTATATGLTGSRVAGEVYTVDCNNVKNY